MRCLVRLLLSLQSCCSILAGVSLVTAGGIYAADMFGAWDGSELGFAAAISIGLGRRYSTKYYVIGITFRWCFVFPWPVRLGDLLLTVILLVILLQYHSACHHHTPVSCRCLGCLLQVSLWQPFQLQNT